MGWFLCAVIGISHLESLLRSVKPERALCAVWRAELSRALSVLADLVVIPRVHADDHTIGMFEVLKGKLERLHHGLLVMTPSARREDLEAETGLVNLLDHFDHIERVRGEEGITDLDRDDRRHLFHFLRRSGDIVEAGHKQIDLPAFVGHLLDAIRIVGRNTGQNASIVDAFDKIMDLPAFALSKQSVGNPTVMDDSDGLSVLDHLFD